MLLADRFANQAARRPDAVAVRDASGEVGYGALLVAADAVARAVAGRRRIALLPRSDAASLATVLGAMAAGTSVVLLHRHLTAAQLDAVLELADPALVIAEAERRPKVLDAVPAERLRTPAELVAAAVHRPEGETAGPSSAGSERPTAPESSRNDEDATPADPTEPTEAETRAAAELLVGLTSGTSGLPKLFARDQASWAATLDRSDAAFAVGPNDVVSLPGPLDHTHFLYGALHALTRGATADLRPLGAAFGGTASSTEIASPTHVYLVPTLAVSLVETLAGVPRPGLREVLSSSAAWPAAARERLARLLPAATLCHFYGASELSFVALDRNRPGETGSGDVGRAFDGVEIEIRDPEDGTPREDGEQGEIHVRSDMLFSGYLTADGLAGGPDEDGWTTVGDLGTLRDERLAIAGRRSDTIVSGGLNVEPAEVEHVLADLSGVAEVACVGLPDERWGAVPVAVLVAANGSLPDRAAVRAHVRDRLPQPSRPRRIFAVDELPRNPRGKLLRAELVARIANGTATEIV